MVISSEAINKTMQTFSPLLIPIFEALLLQQNMHNQLRQAGQ